MKLGSSNKAAGLHGKVMKSSPVWKEYMEYTKISREDFIEDDWEELSVYTELLAECCQEYYGLEERPIGTDREIELESFIGSYKFDSGNGIVIKYNKDKLSEKDFSDIARKIAEWGAMLGSPFLKALLKICSPLTGEYEIALAYSDLLRRYTETALSEYVPPIIEKRRYIAPIPLGKILVPNTISLMSTGQMQCVSQRVRANVVSLPWLLLIRFHSEMVRELASLEKTFERDGELPSIQPTRAIYRNKAYHRSFLASEFQQKLLALAYEIDFRSSDILEKIRKQASTSPSIFDTIVLWEAFIGRRTLLSKVIDDLMAGYALKPVCKLYELWCLRTVLKVLKELLGEYNAPNRLPGCFVFQLMEGKVEVLYNIPPKESMIVKKLRHRGLGVSAGRRPDFTISFTVPSGRKVTIVSDAKYRLREGIGDDDLFRFFWYMVDYAEFSGEDRLEGLFFHVSNSGDIYQKVEREKPKIAIHLVSLKPENIFKAEEVLKEFFSGVIEYCKH